MTNSEKQKFVVEIMAFAYRQTLLECIGTAEDKLPMELLAWSKALLELESEFRQALLKNDVLN